jgi:hypothetical protein
MRSITAFYAWQSDTPGSINRDFINIALRDAAQRISRDSSLDVTLLVDSDTEGIPGTPPVSATILKEDRKVRTFRSGCHFCWENRSSQAAPKPECHGGNGGRPGSVSEIECCTLDVVGEHWILGCILRFMHAKNHFSDTLRSWHFNGEFRGSVSERNCFIIGEIRGHDTYPPSCFSSEILTES